MVSNQNNTAILRTGIEVDQQTTRRAQKIIADFSKSQAQIADDAKKANRELNEQEKALIKIERQAALGKLASVMSETNTEARQLRDELEKLGATDKDIANVVKQVERLNKASAAGARSRFESAESLNSAARQRVGAVGDVDTGLQTIAGGLDRAGAKGISRSLSAAGEVAAVTEGIVQLGAAAPAAVAALGPVGLGLGAVVVALGVTAGAAANELRKAQEAAKEWLATQLEIAELERQTSTEIAPTLDTQQTGFEDAATALEKARAELAAANEAFEAETGRSAESIMSAGLSIREANPFGGDFAGDVLQAREQLKDAQEAFTAAGEQVNRTGQVLLGERVAENDAIQERVANVQAEIAAIDRRSQIEQQARQLAETGSQEQLDATLRQIDLQRSAYEDQLSALAGLDQENADVVTRTAELQRQIADLGQQEQALIDIAEDAIRVREQQAVAESRFNDLVGGIRSGISELSESTQEIGDKLRERQRNLAEKSANEIIKLEEQIVDVREKSAQRVRDINQKLAADEDKLATSRDRDLSSAETDANQARADAQRDANDQLADLERDLAKQRQKIVDDSRRGILDAVGDRDAVALQQAQERRDQELSDLESSGQDQRAEIGRQLERQRRDIAINLERQRQEINQRYRQQLSDTRQAAQAAIAIERQKARAEIDTRRQALQVELNALSKLSQAAQSFAQRLINSANRLSSSRTSTRSGTTSAAQISRPSIGSTSSSGFSLSDVKKSIGQRVGNFFSADSGAILESDGLVYARKNERILRGYQFDALMRNAQGGAQFAPQFNYNGGSRSEFKRIARRQFEEGLERFMDGLNNG